VRTEESKTVGTIITRHLATVLALFAAILAGCGTNAKLAENGKPEPATAAATATPTEATTARPAPVPPVTIPEGTALKIRTTTAISTNSHKAGDSFQASLAEALVVGGNEIAARGAAVKGAVASSDPGGRVKGRARLAIRLTSVELASGEILNIDTNSYARLAPGTKKQDAIKVGAGSGAGAAIGAVAGGGAGAAIGALAGAGAGTGYVLATRGAPATIGSETVISFRLRSPSTVARPN